MHRRNAQQPGDSTIVAPPPLAATLRAEMLRLRKRVASPQPQRFVFPVRKWIKLTQGMESQHREWLLDGIANGFDIHVRDAPGLARSHVRNLPTTAIQKLFLTKWIHSQLDKKMSMWGPFKDDGNLPSMLQGFRASPVGAVPKGIHFEVPERDKKWRGIHHLSHPRNGMSVNSEVDEAWKTVTYPSFREVVKMVHSLGRGALLWTIDAKDAYLRVPIKDQCLKFMCFRWAERVFAFTSLSFGLSSAPHIYTKFADAILWIIKHHTPGIWGTTSEPWVSHSGAAAPPSLEEWVKKYMDDFFGGAPCTDATVALAQYEAVLMWFTVLGVPTQRDKCVSPRTRIKILGFIYDTVEQKLFIPEVKKNEILQLIETMLHPSRTRIEKGIIRSLIGKLRWFSMCLWAGAAFVRRLERIVLTTNATSPDSYKIEIEPIAEDLKWWKFQIANSADGISFADVLRDPACGDVQVTTDAAGNIGVGGYSSSGDWFQERWSSQPRHDVFISHLQPDIYWKEMSAIAIACELWGHLWSSQSVTFRCDNKPTVDALIRRKCTFNREDVMALIRTIASAAHRNRFSPYFVYLEGETNWTADALSRFKIPRFRDDVSHIEMAETQTDCNGTLSDIVAISFPPPSPRPRMSQCRNRRRRGNRGGRKKKKRKLT